MKTRLLSFANGSVAVNYDPGIEQSLLDALFHSDADDTGDIQDNELLGRFTITRGEHSSSLCLRDEQCELYQGDCLVTLAQILTERAMYLLVDKHDAGLVMHAAALTRGLEGILIPGVSGAGKSTIAFWLSHNGYGYLTDELVNIPLGRTVIEGFWRPINIKLYSTCLSDQELNTTDSESGALANGSISMIPRPHLAPGWDLPELKVILFPNIVSDDDHRVRRLSKAEAVLKLVECLINGRNLPNHGFEEVSRLAKTVPVYDLYYSGFDALPDLLAQVLPQDAGAEAAG